MVPRKNLPDVVTILYEPTNIIYDPMYVMCYPFLDFHTFDSGVIPGMEGDSVFSIQNSFLDVFQMSILD